MACILISPSLTSLLRSAGFISRLQMSYKSTEVCVSVGNNTESHSKAVLMC